MTNMPSEQSPSALPLISVCIPHYNGLDLIDACLASVLAQTIAANVEIIIHDDASTDGSVAHIRKLYPEVRLIESDKNVGFCIANNRMATMAQGRYLLLLNNDATLLPEALSTLLAEAERLARPAIITLPQYDAGTGVLLDIGARLDPFLNPVPNRKAGVTVGMVAGACLWIDKTLWEEIGGFPEWFGSIAEDLYLCCRARLGGHPVLALATSGYRHQVGQSFGGGKVSSGELRSTFRRRALSERNKTLVMAITYPAPLMQLMLPIHLGLLVLEGSLLSLLKLDSRFIRHIYLPVFDALIRHRGAWRAARRTAQHSRRIGVADYLAAFDPWPYKLRMLMRYGLPRLR